MKKIIEPKEVRIRVTCPDCGKDNWVFRDSLDYYLPKEFSCIYCKTGFKWNVIITIVEESNG